MCSEKLKEAIHFAVEAHHGIPRKKTSIPYIVHPIGVMKILIQAGMDEEVVIGGLLHDVLEDTGYTHDAIKERFGDKVADIVKGASEPEAIKGNVTDEGKKESWGRRKQHTIDDLKTASFEILMVAFADKLDNLRSIREDYEIYSEEVWKRFNRPKENQEWYYRSLLDVFKVRLEGKPQESLLQQFINEFEKVFPS